MATYDDFNPLPLRRGRRSCRFLLSPDKNFNPLPLRRGRPTAIASMYSAKSSFQSTPSTQRETLKNFTILSCQIHFNPLPLRRGRLTPRRAARKFDNISIHSLYAEGDSAFNKVCQLQTISIHSLYAEGDNSGARDQRGDGNFNPLPLRRGRPRSGSVPVTINLFQSTPSTQRETVLLQAAPASRQHFNPLPLRRGRPEEFHDFELPNPFQSTPSTQRETVDRLESRADVMISIHSLYAEGDGGQGRNGGYGV